MSTQNVIILIIIIINQFELHITLYGFENSYQVLSAHTQWQDMANWV